MREKNTIHLNAMCECVSASASINVCVRMIGVYSPPIEQVFNLAKLMRWPWKFRKSSQHFVVLLSMPLLPLLLLVLHMLRCYSFIRIHVFDFLLLLLRRFFFKCGFLFRFILQLCGAAISFFCRIRICICSRVNVDLFHLYFSLCPFAL